MGRTRPSTVARPAPTRSSGLGRSLRRWLAHEWRWVRRAVAAGAVAARADRYRKHFDAQAHAAILLAHGLSGSPSLRQSYALLDDCPPLRALAGLPARPGGGVGLSFSQLCDSNTGRPAAFLAGLVAGLAARVRRQGAGRALPPGLRAWDSTFLRLSLKHSPWLPGAGGADVPGVRVQVQYTPALDLPEWTEWHTTRTNDGQALDRALADPVRLAQLRGWTLAFDLGYYGHARFAALLAADVHFVCRRQAQAHVEVLAERPVQLAATGIPGGRIAVLADRRIRLGSPNNRAGAVIEGLRLVEATVAPTAKAARRGARPVTYELVTDRWDLDATEVVRCYLWRWDIEQFFRWLKSHVRLPRLLGRSENAVELSIHLALAVHLLSLLAAGALGWARRSPQLLRRLAWALLHLGTLPSRLPASPRQLPLPDWPLPLPEI